MSRPWGWRRGGPPPAFNVHGLLRIFRTIPSHESRFRSNIHPTSRAHRLPNESLGGPSHSDMRLPNAERAVVDETKLRGYLLAAEHPVGRITTAFFWTPHPRMVRHRDCATLASIECGAAEDCR